MVVTRGVAEDALDARFLEDADAAVDLHGLVGGVVAHLGGDKLGHRGLVDERQASIAQGGGVHGGDAGGMDAGGNVSQLELDGLMVRQRAAEGLTELGVADGLFQRSLADAHALGRDRDTARVEYVHGIAEAHAFLADDVLRRDFGVLENDLAGAGGADAHLVVLGIDLHALGTRRHD